MRIIDLYRYEVSGRVTITPNKANEGDKPTKYRLIADEGMILQKEHIKVCAVDTYEPEGWIETVDEAFIPDTSGVTVTAEYYKDK